MKSADQIQAELALAAGAVSASQLDEEAAPVAVTQITRIEAQERLRMLEEKVDRIADRILELREGGRRKRADRAYARAVRFQAEANDLRELLDSPTGQIVRPV